MDHSEQDKLLYWYVHTLLWGRYTGSTESTLNQDLRLIEQSGSTLDRLINQLRQFRGDLRIRPDDFLGWGISARFYPLLYMLTRVYGARDWLTGVQLSRYLLGHLSRLERHHIFPKAFLYQHGYARPEVNALANLTFLTQQTNLQLSDREPAEYFEKIVQQQPGALESHWIPINRELWKVENYRDFLAARRELLAYAANEFLQSLQQGALPKVEAVPDILEQPVKVALGGVASEDEEFRLQALNEWVVQKGLPAGEFRYELVDPHTNELGAVVDLAWPNGLQEGLSQPVAVLLDEGEGMEQIMNAVGYRYFTDETSFRTYILHEVLLAEEATA